MYKPNVYDSTKPTVYNVGTGQYMNEINVFNDKGNIDLKLVDQLKQNRVVAKNDRLNFFDPARRQFADEVYYQHQIKGTVKNLIEYYGMQPSQFDLDHWEKHSDPRVVGYPGIRGVYNSIVSWCYEYLPFRLIWLCKGVFWLGLAMLCTLAGLDTWWQQVITLAGGGIIGGYSLRWFLMAFMP